MSRLVEFSDDELKALEMLMNKLGFNPMQSIPSKPKKISKLEQTILNRNEYRAKKQRRN